MPRADNFPRKPERAGLAGAGSPISQQSVLADGIGAAALIASPSLLTAGPARAVTAVRPAGAGAALAGLHGATLQLSPGMTWAQALADGTL
jgi:hypothetical protein